MISKLRHSVLGIGSQPYKSVGQELVQNIQNHFVADQEQSIAEDRLKARYSWLGGWVLVLVGVVFLFTGGIKSFALISLNELRGDPISQMFQHIGTAVSDFIEQYVPTLWAVLWAIAPYPKGSHPLSWSWLAWAGWSFGLIWVGTSLHKRGSRLYEESEKTARQVTYNLSGANSRLNIQSRDSSTNVVRPDSSGASDASDTGQ
jgi:hypothetical protein